MSALLVSVRTLPAEASDATASIRSILTFFYLFPAADKRKVELVEKYKELKAAGKLDSFLAKRRKKNAAKDHRFIPYRRQGAEGDS